MLPGLGVLEGNCCGGSVSNLSTANLTLFKEILVKSVGLSRDPDSFCVSW